MPFRAGAALAAAGILLLAGCASQPTIYNTSVRQAYSPSAYGYAAGRRDLRTVIEGNPFGIEQARFEEAVTTILNRNPPVLQPTTFTTTPGEDAREAYSALFLFNAPSAVNALSVCARPREVPVVEPEETVRVTGAFCRGEGALSMATGEVAGVAGIDDPRFEALLAQLVDGMFPEFDPTRDDDEIFIPG